MVPVLTQQVEAANQGDHQQRYFQWPDLLATRNRASAGSECVVSMAAGPFVIDGSFEKLSTDAWTMNLHIISMSSENMRRK